MSTSAPAIDTELTAGTLGTADHMGFRAPERESTRPGVEYRQRFSGVLRSENIKFRTLKSNWITLAATCLAIIGFGLMAAAAASGSVSTPNGGPPVNTTEPVSTVLSGAQMFAVLLVAVLGVLIGAREYSSGMVRTTMSAVPARIRSLTARALVFTAWTVPAIFVSVLVAFVAGNAVLESGGVTSAALGDTGVWRVLIGTTGYLVGIGLIGIFLGILLRSIPAGLGTLLGGVLILPSLASVLLPDSWDSALKYLPSNAGSSFTSLTEPDGMLSSGAGVAVFIGWVLLAGIGAALILRRRDV